MFKSEIKKPLLQSLAVIALGLICFGFVVSAESHTFFGSIWAIISGVLYTFLYAIGLTIGVAFCIACLFAIFLGTIYLVSKDQAHSLWNNLKIKLKYNAGEIKDLYNKYGCSCSKSSCNPKKKMEPSVATTPSSPKQDDILTKMNKLEAEIAQLKEREKRNTEIITKLSTEKEGL